MCVLCLARKLLKCLECEFLCMYNQCVRMLARESTAIFDSIQIRLKESLYVPLHIKLQI